MSALALCSNEMIFSEMPRIRRILRGKLGAHQDLDDLAQTVLLELLRSMPNFRGEGTISAFISGIAVRVVRRARQLAARERGRHEALDEEPADHVPGPDAQALSRERIRRADKALGELSNEKRTAFVLWALEGKDPSEIARMTRTSVSATRSRIFYAQRELKARARRDPYLSDLVA
jgi:RNA polymerase sigma-70 factor, ECF subfamily